VQFRHLGFVRDIGHDGKDAVAFLRDFGQRRFAPAADCDGHTCLRQRQRDRPAYAGAAAGDQRVSAGNPRGAHTLNPAAASRSANR
jgi:hypothetical protein